MMMAPLLILMLIKVLLFFNIQSFDADRGVAFLQYPVFYYSREDLLWRSIATEMLSFF